MSAKILITGMHRSGTTLLGDLIAKHPSVQKVFHEVTLIKQPLAQLYAAKELPDNQMIQTKGKLTRARNVRPNMFQVNFSLEHETWGNKMSFPGPVILQDWNQRTTSYIQKWLDFFDSEGKIVHIVRHPFDVFCSMRNRWLSDHVHLTNYGQVSLETLCRDWVTTIEAIQNQFEEDPRFITIRYEDLLIRPEHCLGKIFAAFGLANAADVVQEILAKEVIFFGNLDHSRLFPHRREDLPPLARATSYYLSPLLETFNYTSEGVAKLLKLSEYGSP